MRDGDLLNRLRATFRACHDLTGATRSERFRMGACSDACAALLAVGQMIRLCPEILIPASRCLARRRAGFCLALNHFAMRLTHGRYDPAVLPQGNAAC